MATTLYFIRHGESVTNADKIYTGQLDYPLSELGFKQAELLANYFKDKKIDKIYSSDLTRTHQTIAPTAKLLNLEINDDSRLREVYGGEWQYKTFSEIREKYNADFVQWQKDIVNARCTGGESFKEVSERVYKAVLDIVNENEDKSVIIVAHSNPIKTITLRSEHSTMTDKEKVIAPPNASVTKIVYEDGKFKLIIKGDVSHLNNEIKNRKIDE